MRDQSLSLRILVLAVLLLFVTALCVVALVAVGALAPRISHIAAAGGVILILATLGSAISALGPKYRPTPLLTPLFAGIFVALFASAAVFGIQARIASKHSAVTAVEAAPATRPAAQPAKTVPVIDNASVEPDVRGAPQEPAPAVVPNFDSSDFGPAPMPAQAEAPAPAPVQAQASAPADVQPAAAADVPPLPKDTTNAAAADAAATDKAPVDVANGAPPAQAVEKPAATEGQKKPPVAVAKIPVPATTPPAGKQTADAPINLTGGFDPSGPTAPQAAGPPMVLDAADAAAPHHAAIPPLPRIRPCGGAGPACP